MIEYECLHQNIPERDTPVSLSYLEMKGGVLNLWNEFFLLLIPKQCILL